MRIVITVVVLVILVAACNRVVELFPSLDASARILDAHDDTLDAHHFPDAFVGSDGGLENPDAGIVFDASSPD
ncbi:MAG TPA: hypothetical protein VF403_01135 [Kofleriaceae bacterium]